MAPQNAKARAGGAGTSELGHGKKIDHSEDGTETVLVQAAFQRNVERLHALGPRPLAELLVEIGAARSCMTEIASRLERYAALDPTAVRALGGDRFPPRIWRVA